MRVCSLIPSATEIICELGLIDALVGVSSECRWPPEVAAKPVVSAAWLDPTVQTSVEIDDAVRTSLAEGQSLYVLDAALLDALRPDLIVTQDLCTVCAISSDQLRPVCPVNAQVLSLDPHTLGDIVASVRTLADALGVTERGAAIAAAMQATLEAVRGAVAGRARRRLFVAEWIDPPYCAGHWLPEMIEIAGGIDVLGRAGQPSHATTWAAVLAARPELIVIAPCGFDVAEAARRAAGFGLPVPAIAVDGDAYFSRPGPRLADGVRQLAHLLHPDAVADPGLPAIPLGTIATAHQS